MARVRLKKAVGLISQERVLVDDFPDHPFQVRMDEDTLLFLVIFVIAVGGLLKTQAFDQEGWKIRDQEQVAACYAQDRLLQAWGFDSATQRFC